MGNDIIEKKDLEEVLEQERFFNNAIIKSIPGSFYLLDKDGKYVRWNDYQRDEIIGRPEDQIAGMNAIETIHPDDRALIQSKIENVLVNGGSEAVEGRVLLRGGPAFRWLLMTGQQIIIDGSPFLIGTGVDITERKKDEEDIVSSHRLLQRIIDLLPVRIFWKDKDLRYLGCNKIFAQDAGKDDPEDMIGKDDFEMTWRDQAILYREDDQNVIRSGIAKINFEEPQTTPEGNTIWLKTSKIPLTDRQGNMVGILGSYEDITERKQAEEEKKKHSEELEKVNKLMVGRELRMSELKKEVEELRAKVAGK